MVATIDMELEGLVVPEDYFLQFSDLIIRSLDMANGFICSKEEIFEEIHNQIVAKLENLPQKIGVLCGGGVDSTYLLTICSVLKKDIVAISSISSDNSLALTQLDRFCSARGYLHIKHVLTDSVYQKRVDEFKKIYDRNPRDPVAPIVSELANVARQNSVLTLIDGQFADTAFFQNPQNKLFNATHAFPKILPKLTNVNGTHKFSKTIQLLTYFTLTLPEKILYLCRVEITRATVRFVEKLLVKNEPKTILQIIFWQVLLNYRERDKYKNIQVGIYSPFDEIEFLYMLNKRYVNIKKEMKNFITKNSEIDLSIIKSSSFRVR